MKLNAGSGRHYVDGWVNMDVDEGFPLDVKADLTAIPLPDESVDMIFAAHLLEHLDYWETLPLVLAEFARVLAPLGELCVVGPDIERAVLMGEPRPLLELIVAWPDDFNVGRWPVKSPPAGHAWTASSGFVVRALEFAGFTCTPYTGVLGELQGLGWPLDNTADWQNAFVCGYDE